MSWADAGRLRPLSTIVFTAHSANVAKVIRGKIDSQQKEDNGIRVLAVCANLFRESC